MRYNLLEMVLVKRRKEGEESTDWYTHSIRDSRGD